MGMGADKLVPALLGDAAAEEIGAAVTAEHDTRFRRVIADVEPLPGARDLLSALKRRGLTVLLGSSAAAEEVDHYLRLLDGQGAGRPRDDGRRRRPHQARPRPDPNRHRPGRRAGRRHDRGHSVGSVVPPLHSTCGRSACCAEGSRKASCGVLAHTVSIGIRQYLCPNSMSCSADGLLDGPSVADVRSGGASERRQSQRVGVGGVIGCALRPDRGVHRAQAKMVETGPQRANALEQQLAALQFDDRGHRRPRSSVPFDLKRPILSPS